MGDWHVIVVDGPEREIRAFVAGFLADRKAAPSAVAFGNDVGLDGADHVLLASGDLAPALGDALAERGPALGLHVKKPRAVARASFAMHAEADSRDVSAQLRAALRGAPMSQHAESEAEHADASVHAYAYRVRATVNGPVEDVLAVRRRLGAVEAAQIEPLRLE